MAMDETGQVRPTDGDIYSPILEGDAFDVREASSRRAMFLLAGAFIFLLVIAIGLLKAYGPGTRGPNDPPRILADTSPYKSTPEDPGGAQTPNQDKTVYDVVSGDSRAEDVVLAPVPEEPLRVQPNVNAATVIVKKPEAAPKPSAPKAPTVRAPIPATLPATIPATGSIAIGNSDYVVQVASLRSAGEASEGWINLNSRLGDLIPAGLFADIKRADLGDRGVWHRLRVSGFADKNSATSFCTRLKSRGQDCIVVQK